MKNEILGPTLFMLLLLLISCGFRFWRNDHSLKDRAAADLPMYRVPINSCSTGELEVLPGIAQKKAASISRYRRMNGKITTWDELTVVDGIGGKTAEKISGKAVLE